MTGWLDGALDYVGRWIAFQLRHQGQPGVAVAVAHEGEVVLDLAFGVADLATGEALTPRHRMRVASHSKSFTAAGIMRLLEAGKLRLDDRCGSYVDGLHSSVAAATLGQLLSHSAGIVRDGPDSSQFVDRIPYRSRDELLADLSEPSPIETGAQLKYSNHGYGLLGLVIESVTGQGYAAWMTEHILRPAGLAETAPDPAFDGEVPTASGHSGLLPLGRRVVVPARNETRAMAPAAGFVSTASDLVRFFGQLDPGAHQSVLSAASRREMTRRHWRDDHASIERHYGLGVMSGVPGPWAHFGHSGGFQGFISRTAVIPAKRLAVSVVTNQIDGLAHPWLDGIVHILQRCQEAGEVPADRGAWAGRWWSIWGAVDLVPVGKRVLAAIPAAFTPFADVAEIEVTGDDEGKVATASAYSSPGELAGITRDPDGRAVEVRIGGAWLVPEAELVAEMERRYGGVPATAGVVAASPM